MSLKKFIKSLTITKVSPIILNRKIYKTECIELDNERFYTAHYTIKTTKEMCYCNVEKRDVPTVVIESINIHYLELDDGETMQKVEECDRLLFKKIINDIEDNHAKRQ